MTHAEASKRASELWTGVYLTSREDHGWKVTLHGPGGPVHWLDTYGRVACGAHGCSLSNES